MSLLRLLRAGKSLIGAREPAGRYRLLNGPALPKFGTDKNPFREPVRTKQVTAAPEVAPATTSPPVKLATSDLPKVVPQEAAIHEQPAAKPVERKPVVESSRKEKHVSSRPKVEINTKPETLVTVASKPSGPSGPTGVVAAGARAAARVLRLNSKLNPLFGWVRPKGGARALPRTDPMVQGELSLDRVKVVRNDLSDSDLEIVPARKPSQPTLSAPELAAAQGSPQRAWERMASRLFGAGKT